MLKRYIVLLLFFLPVLAWAQEVYEHPASGLRFPQTLGVFERVSMKRFDDPKLGVQVGYGAAGLGKVDFYIFDYGLSPIPDGTESDYVRAAYAAADKEIQGFAAAGKYRNLEYLVPLGSVMGPKGQGLDWLVSSYKFQIGDTGSESALSWLLVRGYRSQFVKIRFTHLAAKAKEGRAAIDGLLEAFWEANKR